MPEMQAPENVRLVVGGREYPCEVRRQPDEDHEHGDGVTCYAWLLIPSGVIVAGPGDEYLIRAGTLPPNICLLFDFSIPLPLGDLN